MFYVTCSFSNLRQHDSLKTGFSDNTGNQGGCLMAFLVGEAFSMLLLAYMLEDVRAEAQSEAFLQLAGYEVAW